LTLVSYDSRSTITTARETLELEYEWPRYHMKTKSDT